MALQFNQISTMTELLNSNAKGVYIIAATPFQPDGAIDFESIDSLVEFYLAQGVHGMTILGMMGEAPKLTTLEALAVAQRFIRRTAGRVPVVVGASAAGYASVAELSKAVMDFGAAGVMVAPASGIRSDDGFYAYFEAIAQKLGAAIPIVVQDFPQATGVPMAAKTYVRLAENIPQVVMLKHEDCPGLDKLTQIRATATRRTSILVGNGGLYYVQELERGADGAMTGFAYPEMLVDVYNLFRQGEVEAAEDVYDAYLPLVRFEQQPGFGLAARKEVLFQRGAIRSSAQRAPAIGFGPEDRRQLDRLVQRLGRRLCELGRAVPVQAHQV
jgi:4-hydroxy-tetrahydrodipicolinate synthase